MARTTHRNRTTLLPRRLAALSGGLVILLMAAPATAASRGNTSAAEAARQLRSVGITQLPGRDADPHDGMGPLDHDGSHAHGGATSGTSTPTGSRTATVAAPVMAAATLPTATVDDAWSLASTFRTTDGWYAAPIHATLLKDGRIFFVGIAREANPPETALKWRRVAWVFTPPALGARVPAATTITEIAEPVELDAVTVGTSYYVNDDFYCMGQTLTDDGKVVTAGGTRAFTELPTGVQHTFGLPYESVFDGTTWTRQAGNMLGKGPFGNPTRWYPTVTRLPDARTLVSGGLEVIAGPDKIGFANHTVETLDTHTGARTLFSDADQTPVVTQARDYTHVFVLPYAGAPYDLLEIGESAIPVLANSTTPGAWLTTPQARPGNGGESTDWGTSSAMLPLRLNNGQSGYYNGAVLQASGDMGTPFEHRADVYDPLTGWRAAPIELTAPRHHPSTVVLPDSRVLIVNGHDVMGGTAAQQAQYVDPTAQFGVTAGMTASGVTRGYHSIALLLPDGRVLVAGGRDVNTKTSLEKPSYQIYTPDYLKRTRPVVAVAPTPLHYGQQFALGTTGPIPTSMMLMGLGSMTHSFDSNQRAIELPMGSAPSPTGGPRLVIGGAPADSHVAPPGDYMLFVLDANRTPSAGRVVHLD